MTVMTMMAGKVRVEMKMTANMMAKKTKIMTMTEGPDS